MFLFSTFIGLIIKILNSSDKSLIGLKGKVVDETKNLLVIEVKGKEKKIPKASCSFLFYLKDEKIVVDGKKIAFRPEERPKKVKV